MPLVWDDPSGWTRRAPTTGSRAAEYAIPRAPSDSEDAECTVVTFGPRQGGTPDQNLDRWIGQFRDLTGRPVKATRPSNRTGGLEIKRVEVAGTYMAMQLPGEHAPPDPKHGYRLIGAVIEAPSGLWFFKLTGPDATVQAASHDFDQMVQSAHPRG